MAQLNDTQINGDLTVIGKASLASTADTTPTSNYDLTPKKYVDDQISELNSKRLGYFYLIDNNVTSASTTLTLQYGRKFSDYDYLVFAVKDGSHFRNPSILPREVFSNNSVEIDYSNLDALRWVVAQYISDTQMSVMGESNNAQRLTVFGFKFTT